MKIVYQLLAGFLAIVLLFAAAGAVSIVELRSIETANAAVERDTRIHEQAVSYERGARQVQLGAYLYAHGNEPMGRQLVAEGGADMKGSRAALKASLGADTVQAVDEIARLEGLAAAAVDDVVKRVKAKGDAKLIGRDLEFLAARVEALNLLLADFGDRTQVTAAASLAAAQAAARRTVQVTFGAIGGSLGLALLLALWVAGRISRPVKHFTAMADKVSKGDMDQQLEVTGSGEIRDLAQAFGRMINCFKMMESMLRDEAQDGSP